MPSVPSGGRGSLDLYCRYGIIYILMSFELRNSRTEWCGETPFLPFENLNPMEYYGLIVDGVNHSNIEDLTIRLEHIALPDGVVVAAVGSDGKLERYAQSKTELIIIEESESLQADIILKEHFKDEGYSTIFDVGPEDQIDVKVLDSPSPVSYAFNDAQSLYPDRILNAFPVFPVSNEGLDLYYKARQKVLVEMSENKKVRTELKDQLRSYKRSMQTGEFRRIPIFDRDNHVQYYSELWPAYSTGFKAAFLRAIQRKLDVFTVELGHTQSYEETARTMPTTTLGRLDYLAERGVIDEEIASSAGYAYAWFLQQYHRIQEDYKQKMQPTQLSFDAVDFDTHNQAACRFVQL